MDEPRWLVDEMLGRLARYLRFLGYDAENVRGVADDEIVRRARAENRRVVTRDRALARALPDSVLLTRTDIAGQMRELQTAFPTLRLDVRLDRCSLCNGRLSITERVPPEAARAVSVPLEVREGRISLYSCTQCGHLYWEGSHTQSVRSRLAEWFPAAQGPR
jgi:uncharacterized protein